MALINCPECGSSVSDKAVHCPKCGYPLTPPTLSGGNTSMSGPQYVAAKPLMPPSGGAYVHLSQQAPPLPQVAPVNNLLPPQSQKKSEVLAFVLPFFFSVLGVFYADTKKASYLLGIMIGLNIINVALFNDDPDTWWSIALLLTFIFWIASLVISVNAVSRYNDRLARQELGLPSNIDGSDTVETLYILVQNEKGRSALDPSNRIAISNLLVDYCNTEEQARYLITEYRNRYHADLVAELSSLSNAYQQISESLAVFIHFGIVSATYPHDYLVKV